MKSANDLPALSDQSGPNDVALVPNSGVQFIDLPIQLSSVNIETEWFEEPDGEGRVVLRRLEVNEADNRRYYDRPEGRRYPQPSQQDDPRFYDFATRTALTPFLGKWVPLPFLEVMTPGEPGRRKLAPGPENWVRIRIVELTRPDSGGQSHRAVLAFDTGTQPAGGAYLAPRDGRSGDFVLASTLEEVSWLLDPHRDPAWLPGWLEELYRERDGQGNRIDPQTPIGLQHLAAYLTFLEVLQASGAFTRVRMLRLTEDQNYVDVDLVLDLGNSRGCAFLIEQVPGQARRVTDAYRLELRELTRPEETSDLPFESRVEFARPGFGKDDWSEASGRTGAFDWPSPVRIGPEAVRLSSLNRGNEGQTGLSSPKRYLWDDRKRLSPWRYNLATSPDGLVIGAFLEHVSEDGAVLSATGSGEISMSALFSRASLFTFYLLEVLLQARAQMNSFAVREGRMEKLVPRRLVSLVLTLPPAMPLEEVKAVRARADAAIHLLRDVTLGMGARPRSLEAAAEAVREKRMDIGIEAKLDEATATQIVYLYDQISQVYRGDAPLYLNIAGRPRTQPGQTTPQPSLRIASIDVGGGTTDLAIQTYGLDHNVVVPTEEFREGFRLAGDDVLENVVMRHVMPGLTQALVEAGLTPERARAFVIGTFRGPLPTEPERQARRLVLNHVLAPAAVALMADYEAWDLLSPAGTTMRTLAELLAPSQGGRTAKLPRDTAGRGNRDSAAGRASQWLEERAQLAGAPQFRLDRVRLLSEVAALHETVRQTLREALDPLCEIVQRFDCDAILLSGRGSRWPATLELVTGSMAVPPHRVHPMHKHRVGAWYPFPDAAGRISDPKTTVAVGAMLQRLLRGGQLDNLAMREKFGTRSTARYIGKVESNGRIRPEEVFFRKVDLDSDVEVDEEQSVTFPGNCFLGFRQFAAERWPATRLYRLAFGPGVTTQGISMPVTVRLRRDQKADPRGGDSGLKFKIVEGSVMDRDGKPLRRGTIVLSLQTTPGDEGSHWLDSGQLETLDAMLGMGARG
ncbi:virulence factor SrfB [Roseomonas sp. F4]